MAYSFDNGSSEALERNGAAVSSATSPLTISAWFNADAFPTTNWVVNVIAGVWDDDVAAYTGIYIGIMQAGDGNDYLCAVHRNGGAQSYAVIPTSGNISTGTWYHALGTFPDDDSREIYLNANQGADQGGTQTPANITDTSIGCALRNSDAGYWDGYLAEVAIWNVVLGAGEIAALAAGYSPLFIRPASLDCYAPLVSNFQDVVNGTDFAYANPPSVSSHIPIIYPSGQDIYYTAQGMTIPQFWHHYDKNIGAR